MDTFLSFLRSQYSFLSFLGSGSLRIWPDLALPVFYSGTFGDFRQFLSLRFLW